MPPDSNQNVSNRQAWDQRFRDYQGFKAVGCGGFTENYNLWLYRLRKARFDYVVNRLNAPVSECRVLDVGSGSGFYIDLWQRMGARELEGLDFSSTAVERLRQNFPGITFHHASLTDSELSLESGAYDIISAYDVLFHITDDSGYQQALSNICRALKPGGLLIFSENFVHFDRPRESDYHFSRSLELISNMLQHAGLQLQWRRPMFVLSNAPDDSRNPLLKKWWKIVSMVAMHGEKAGWLAGASLYPIERLLTRLLSESPTTEVALATKQE